MSAYYSPSRAGHARAQPPLCLIQPVVHLLFVQAERRGDLARLLPEIVAPEQYLAVRLCERVHRRVERGAPFPGKQRLRYAQRIGKLDLLERYGAAAQNFPAAVEGASAPRSKATS